MVIFPFMMNSTDGSCSYNNHCCVQYMSHSYFESFTSSEASGFEAHHRPDEEEVKYDGLHQRFK